ncbi:MAG TPA: heavy metal translocating P-type ATPase [Thermoplasmata archaeon]|nr:heavy metal translocating P-type ATPase [Thermoplasmata archaeon]
MATDPVCGMYVDEQSAELTLSRENRTYYFCSSACLDAFSTPERRLLQLRRSLMIAWPLAAAVVVLTYAVDSRDGFFASAALAAVVQFYSGREFYRGTWDAVRSRVWNMDVLIAVATTVAFGYSLTALLLPSLLVSAYYFDASALIIALILSGNYLELLTRRRASGTLRALADLLPAQARILSPEGPREIPLEQVTVGARVLVRPGDHFPVDGVVRAGRTTVDESLLTGESVLVPKSPGTTITAGSVNGDGAVEVEATRVGADTFLAEVGRLVSAAETSQVPLQRLADRIAQRFVPFVLVLAGAAAIAWALSGVGITFAVLVFVSVAITACPCAFGIATPAAIVVGTGRAAGSGILFRGRDAIERAARANTLLTDKTGTLTLGRPTVARIGAVAPVSEREVLALAAGLSVGANHPFARAVLEHARSGGVAPLVVQDPRSEPGVGAFGSQGPDRLAIVALPSAPVTTVGGAAGDHLQIALARRSGRSASAVLRNGSVVGVIEFDDPVAPGAREAVRALGEDGVQVAIVSGDRREVVERVAAEVGISEVHASASPVEKARLVRELHDRGRSVAFAGDGINDAPALAAADVGIAVGTGTDVAREAGQVLLLRHGFASIAMALRLSRATVRKVRQNLVWAIGYNAVLLPVAAGALVPVFGLPVISVLPIVGAVAMALSSTSVVLNSFSLRWVSLGDAPRRGTAPMPARPAASA